MWHWKPPVEDFEGLPSLRISFEIVTRSISAHPIGHIWLSSPAITPVPQMRWTRNLKQDTVTKDQDRGLASSGEQSENPESGCQRIRGSAKINSKGLGIETA